MKKKFFLSTFVLPGEMKKTFRLLLGVAWLFFIGSLPILALADDLVVQTQSGAVQGIPVGTTEQWRGIPYAASPTEDRRWKAPEPPIAWDGIRDGSTFGSPCLQGDPSQGPLIGSENCLFLNVFRPTGTPADAKLPVLVHIHGGGNVFASGLEVTDALVNEGIIVVTMNYRLGIMGFLAHPLLTDENGGVGSGN